MSTIGIVVLAVALAATAAAAWWQRTRDGAVRPRSREEEQVTESSIAESAAFENLGVRAGEADLTVVQFSTAFCGPCRATRARLQQLRTTRPGLAYVHVDAESHLDEVRALDVRSTPTLFFLDRAGTVLGRADSAPAAAELTALVDARLGPRG